jgi:drug/metabolite transporter (DMT)-like permease
MTVTKSPITTSPLTGLYLRLTCVPAIWGGTFIAGRIVSAHLPAASAAFIRFVLAALALLLALHLSQGLRALIQITRRQLLGTVALGATGILAYNLFFFSALAEMPAGRTSLIVALNPAVTLLVAAVLLGERLSAARWLGVGLALLGVWIVVTRGDLLQLMQSVGKGELSMLGAVCAWAAYTLIGRKVLQGLSPVLATLWAVLWGVLFLGVLGTAVAFVWYYEGINKLGAARTVVFNNLVPIFGVLLGWLLLNEPVSGSVIIGGGMAIVGIFLVNRIKP